MKTFLKILGLIFISQVLPLVFLFGYFVLIRNEMVSIDEIDSKSMIASFGLKPFLFFSQILSVLLPAIIYILIAHGRDFISGVKLKMPANRHFFMYGVMLLILSYPLIQMSADLNKYMPFADFLKEEGDYINQLMKQILLVNTPLDFGLNILILALLPAIGEELFFRAIIQNELLDNMNNKDVAIILTALVFSAFHLQFDGFLPRFFLGLILGYTYFWSGSIWVPVSLHFLNNGLLVFSAYFFQDKINELSTETPQTIPMHIMLMSLVAVFVLRKKMIEMSNERVNLEL